MATCRDCKLFDLDGVRNRAGNVMKNRVARCLWVSDEVWPNSVMPSVNSRPKAGYVSAQDGFGCKRFIKRKD